MYTSFHPRRRPNKTETKPQHTSSAFLPYIQSPKSVKPYWKNTGHIQHQVHISPATQDSLCSLTSQGQPRFENQWSECGAVYIREMGHMTGQSREAPDRPLWLFNTQNVQWWYSMPSTITTAFTSITSQFYQNCLTTPTVICEAIKFSLHHNFNKEGGYQLSLAWSLSSIFFGNINDASDLLTPHVWLQCPIHPF